MSNGPFYFAWVRPDQTTFDEATMLVEDEDIFDFAIHHDEGQFATLTLTIRNPRIGLLNAGRKLWAWFAYRDSTGHIRPLFFGVLTSIPTDMFQELVELKFNARPQDYIFAKQTLAEHLKIRPYYDPVFLDDAHRDDPDAILEGWSKLYHIDRLTHVVTVSDILEGEDGTITFDETMGIYDTVKMEMGEAPLSVVQVQAAVEWTQRSIGVLPKPVNVNVSSYTGGSFKSDWPKPGAQLGGGWECEASYVTDVLGTEHSKSQSGSSSVTNLDAEALDCSYDTASDSWTMSAIPGIPVDGKVEEVIGWCDPWGIPFSQFQEDAFDPDFIPAGVNIPASVNSTGTLALLWQLNCTMNLKYNASREFSEQVTINVAANVQNTVVSPLLDQHTEVLKVSGQNVGQPLMSINAWTDFAGQAVSLSEVTTPNDRSRVPGGNSYQICVVPGIAGTIEPFFSDIPGRITFDGTVQWASLGDNPPTTQPAWTDSTDMPIGEIRLYEPKVFRDETGNFEKTGESCYLMCIREGTTKNDFVQFTYIPSATSNDDALPEPVNTAYIPGPAQDSPYSAPILTFGHRVMDGSVEWMSLGTYPPFLGIPIGGSTENVTARSYFTQGRGYWSIEYLICRARARLRNRARCLKVSWEAAFEDCLDLSLRKNATILDGRIPGGAATGKVQSYTLSGSRTGDLRGSVQIGVCVGYGNSVPDVTGTPEYTAATGYMTAGYQLYDGGQYSIAEEDISYTPPAFQPFDDGLAFPLQDFPGVIVMTTPDQVKGVQDALLAEGTSFLFAGDMPFARTTADQSSNTGSTAIFTEILGELSIDTKSPGLIGHTSPGEFLLDGINPNEYALNAKPVTCEIIIHPVTNGPFNGSIVVYTSPLELPQGVNLSADSS